MAKSATFSVVKASAHSSEHNSREDTPEYLIGFVEGEENIYNLRHSDSQFLELAKVKYQEITGQKMQQKQIDALIKETVLSLENHHTEADVQKIFDTLNEKYGGHYITELSIHKDEGHFEDKDGIAYYPTKDILQKEDGWYIVPLDKSTEMKPSYKPKIHEFSEKVDINELKPIHNYHAHVKFSMFDLDTGKTGRMKHNELNDRIKTAAQVLKLDYSPEKGSKGRVAVEQIKTRHKAVRNEKIKSLDKSLKVDKSLDLYKYGNQLLAKEIEELKIERKTLKEELQALKEQKAGERAILQENNALRADYAQMEAKFKALEAEAREQAKLPKAQKTNENLISEALKDIDEIKTVYPALGDKELVKKDVNGREIDPIDELVRASTMAVEEKGLIYTTTKQVFNKDVFIKKVKERENEHQKLHQEKNGIIKALEYAKEKTKTALQSVFSKFSGKSIGEALKERTELLNKPRGLEEIVKELNKQNEQQKSKGLER